MSAQDRYVPIEDVPASESLAVSALVPVKSKIRIGSFLFEASSVNDSKQTITFKLAGFFPPDQPQPEPVFS